MVSKKLALTGILSSGDKLFDSSIKVASILHGELNELLNKATLIENKIAFEKNASTIDDILSQLKAKRSDLKEITQMLEEDVTTFDDDFLEELDKECSAVSELLPDFNGYEEFPIISGNMNDEVAMLKQHVVTIRQILSAVTELTRLFRFVNKNV